MNTTAQAKPKMEGSMGLAWAITLASRLQGKEVDRLRLHEAISAHLPAIAALSEQPGLVIDQHTTNWDNLLKRVATSAGIQGIEFYEKPDAARVPFISWSAELGWVLVRSLAPNGQWLVDAGGQGVSIPPENIFPVARLVFEENSRPISGKPVFQLFREAFLTHRTTLIEVAIAGVLINLLALATSLYSMQIYDRVIPTQGYATLTVLTIGVALTILFELLVKIVRSSLMEDVVVKVDSKLSRAIFSRLLQIRMDQLPGSVGSLSAQLRGYETIRGFLSASTLYIFVDIPFALIFMLMIGFIGVVSLAFIPFVFLAIAISLGYVLQKRIEWHAVNSTKASNQKMGLLVETIEGAETIKSGSGGWGALSKWIDKTEEAMQHDMALRNISERSTFITATLQQVSYVALMATGAYFAAEGFITMGALIACSILSGRILGPVASIPGLMVQQANAKAALDGLEKLFVLKVDNDGIARPMMPDTIHGEFRLERVRFAYEGASKALSIQAMQIRAGEKIGVIGAIGSGKSTLLRLLTGMYQPNEGRVLLDGLVIDQISRHLLGEKIGYLQQDHRLFSGTLRENLLVGLPDPGDEVIRECAAKSGLLATVTNHPKGLDLMIVEGGKGLSGGQRQLVALTRVILSKPSLWLLDEPTASMDEASENRCIQFLRETIQPEQTMILVTHKLSLLQMVERLILIHNHEVVLDGPRDEVLKRLANKAAPQQGTKSKS